jgi:molecular chaperone HtpG
VPEATGPDEGFKSVSFSADDIGVQLLESITKGLYTDARNCIREYIQNEFDASARNIELEIAGRRVYITGDGSGMTKDGLLQAQRIGYSDKDPMTQAGFRGIGIWSGVAICRRLNVITKRPDEAEGHYLKVDAEGLRREISGRTGKSLVQALSDHVFMKTVRRGELVLKGGTRVELVDVLSEHDTILSQPALYRYLEQVAPVPMDPDQPISSKIEERLQLLVPGYRTLAVRLNNRRIFRPPLRKTVLQAPKFRWIERETGGKLALVWYAMNSRPGVITDPEQRGLVYKAKGFTIGDVERTTIRKLAPPGAVGTGWVVGEVHLTCPDLLPNSERIDLESTPAANETRDELTDLLSQIEKEVRDFSHERASESHLLEAAEVVKATFEERDPTKRVDKIASIERLIRVLKEHHSSNRTPQEVKPRIETALRDLGRARGMVLKGLETPTAPQTSEAPGPKPKPRSAVRARAEVEELVPRFAKELGLSAEGSQLIRDAVDCLRAVGASEPLILRFLRSLQSSTKVRKASS